MGRGGSVTFDFSYIVLSCKKVLLYAYYGLQQLVEKIVLAYGTGGYYGIPGFTSGG